jgi:hypothetical protein
MAADTYRQVILLDEGVFEFADAIDVVMAIPVTTTFGNPWPVARLFIYGPPRVRA